VGHCLMDSVRAELVGLGPRLLETRGICLGRVGEFLGLSSLVRRTKTSSTDSRIAERLGVALPKRRGHAAVVAGHWAVGS
jgi:hypothetical protein